MKPDNLHNARCQFRRARYGVRSLFPHREQCLIDR